MIVREVVTTFIICTFVLAAIVGSWIIQGPTENKIKKQEKSCIDWMNPKQSTKCDKDHL